ncbi:MAG: primary-amine oxidase [Bryobacteraceae bacterium]
MHPLDPLDAQEMETAMRVVRGARKLQGDYMVAQIALKEPDKYAVLAGRPTVREAAVVVYDRSSNSTYEAVIGLASARLTSYTKIPGAQPAISGEDSVLADQAVRSNLQWQAAMRKRGIANPAADVAIDFWSAGNFGLPEDSGARIVRGICYLRGRTSNYYARPVEGVVAVVDLSERKVLKLVDTGVVPIPKETFDYEDGAAGRLREAPKPLRIVQSSGPSFQIVDGEVRWQKWRFRFAMHPREGLILYLVRYSDAGRERSILYRGSLSEMAVPYGDPGAGWFFRNSFDAGELGMGHVASSLRLGFDCPNNATLFDAVMADERGVPIGMPHVAALYERDAGISWKHGGETRRARDLVLGYVSTVGNYDYAFDWVFHQDGTLEMKTGLTGVMSVKAVNPDAPDHADHGHMVGKALSAVHHQHFFNFRLDLDIDGADGNQAIEMNTVAAPPGKSNPYGGAFDMTETVLHNESEAMRQMDLASSRRWKIVNPSVKNSLGGPVGYALLPGENARPFAAPDSSIRRRAGFLNYPFWVTPYKAGEMYSGGDYPNQSQGGEGLTKWTSANRPIDGKDVVVWYTLGITHNPRPEDWPVMPVHEAGFKLVPLGFFSRNPALDLP